jgi:hypothetical protein
MNLPKNKIIDKVLLIVDKYFSEAAIVILSGSYDTDRFNLKTSDIDVVIIDKLVNTGYTKKERLDNELYDFNIIPLTKIDKVIKSDIISMRGIMTSMLLTGKVIKDDLMLMPHIIKYVKESLIKLYPCFTLKEIEKKCIKINYLLQGLENNKNRFLEDYYLLNDISDHYLDLVLNENKKFKGIGKHKIRNLEVFQINRLEKIIKEFLVENKKQNFINFIEDEIKRYKKRTNSFSERELDNLSNSPCMRVSIPSNDVKAQNFEESFALLNEKLNNMGDKILFIQKENEMCNLLILNNRDRSKVCFDIAQYLTFRFDTVYRIQVNSIHKSLINDSFQNIFKLYMELVLKKMNRNERVDLLSILFKKILNNHNIKKREAEKLFEHLELLWIPAGYDLFLKLDYESLKEYKKNSITKFEKLAKNYKPNSSLQHDKIADELMALFNEMISNDEKSFFITPELQNLDEKIKKKIVLIEKYFSIVIQLFLSEKDKPFVSAILKKTILS